VTATPASTTPVVSRLGARQTALFASAAVVLVAVAGIWWWRAAAEPSLGWITETVDRGAIEVVVLATGTVNPVTKVQVGTYVSGPILELFADFNSPVTKGQLVAKIDPRPFEVKVKQAEANLATAEARVARARADLALKKLAFERNTTLRARDLIAQLDLDTARSDHQQAQAQLALEQAGVQQAQAQLDETRINLGYTNITSPVDGVVVSRSVDVGQTVAASFQTPVLFEIAQDLTKMQVDAAVSESDIGGVTEGQKAWFSVDSHPTRRFEGRVTQVRNAPIALQNVVTYVVVIAVENPDHALKPGMTATVAIETARRDDAVRIPQRALRFHPEEVERDPDATVVWRLAARGEPERVEIEAGIRNESWVEQTGGALAPGDAVVVARERAETDDEPAAVSPFQPQRRR
jgi:HlyD family secretion protein